MHVHHDSFPPYHFFTRNAACDSSPLEQQRDLKTLLLVSLLPPNCYLSFGLCKRFIFIVLLWNAEAKEPHLHSLCFNETMVVCFLTLSIFFYESDRSLMRARTDAARPPTASLSDSDVTDHSADSQFSVRLFCGQSIKRDHAMDDTVWEINFSVLAWTVQGGRKEAEERKKW